MRPPRSTPLPIDTGLLRPGLRLAVGLSGGADSVALLRVLHQCAAGLGLVLHAAHLHHGLRGAEAGADIEFARALAAELGLPFHEARVDTAAEAKKNNQTIEEAARHLRYSWFRQLLAETPLDAIATAHTLDDQAETVLAKFLRGAWTEGLSGIHPVVDFHEGRILRPLLAATRAQVEAYLQSIGQTWREDSSNRHLTFTRNRIRHELLPQLESWNPRLREHLAQMAALARDEEDWWQAELARRVPQHILAGRPIRGGGRAAAEALALDVTRLAALPTAVQRRLLRHAALQLGAAPDFAATEALRHLALGGKAGQKRELAHGLLAERTPRELRLSLAPAPAAREAASEQGSESIPAYTVAIPGAVAAPAFALHLTLSLQNPGQDQIAHRLATLRNWRPGDRVRIRYSQAPKKVKEVLERMRVTGTARRVWPVLELDGRILWMRGVELEPEPGLIIHAVPLDLASAAPVIPPLSPPAPQA